MFSSLGILSLLMCLIFGLAFLMTWGWRKLLLFTLFWIIFEALPRRYILNDISFFFIKDVFLLLVYIAFIKEKINKRYLLGKFPNPDLALVALFYWGIVEVFNPLMSNIFTGLFGLRVWFWYIPLMYIGKECFEGKSQMFRFLKVYILVSIPIFILGFIQHLLPWTHPLNQTYISYSLQLAGEQSRSPATFASNSAFSDYVLHVTTFVFMLFLNRSIKNWLIITFFISLFLAIAATGQTGLLMSLLIEIGVILILISLINTERKRVLLLGFSSVLIMLVATKIFPKYSYQAGIGRAAKAITNSDYFMARLHEHSIGPISYIIGKNPIFGHGIGSSSIGLKYVIQISDVEPLRTFESGYGKIIWETGFIGFFLMMWFLGSLMLRTFRTFLNSTDADLKILCAVILGLQLGLLGWMFIIQKLDHYTFAILFWFTNSLPGVLQKEANLSA